MNHDPRYFKEPDKFIPERWLDDKRFISDVKSAFQPFGVGPRSCAGRRFVAYHLLFFFFGFFQGYAHHNFMVSNTDIRRSLAIAEMKLIISRILWNFDLDLPLESATWADNLKIYHLWDITPFYIKLTPVKRG
jgi:hypothetical protein